jgi:hypothetical protein
MKDCTTISIHKPTKERLLLLFKQNEEPFEDWDTAITDLINYVCEKEGLKL